MMGPRRPRGAMRARPRPFASLRSRNWEMRPSTNPRSSSPALGSVHGSAELTALVDGSAEFGEYRTWRFLDRASGGPLGRPSAPPRLPWRRGISWETCPTFGGSMDSFGRFGPKGDAQRLKCSLSTFCVQASKKRSENALPANVLICRAAFLCWLSMIIRIIRWGPPVFECLTQCACVCVFVCLYVSIAQQSA